MSFYNDASLIMLPSAGAGKDGKAYSVKPTDGTGDFTFSRGSNLSATRIGEDGYIEKGYDNLLLQSNTFSAAAWTKFQSSVTGGQLGYDGTNDAWLLNSVVTGGQVLQQINFSGVYTFTLYAKKSSVNQINVRLGPAGGAANNVTFDLNLGSVFSSAGNVIDNSITIVGDGWYKISLTINESSGSYINVYPYENGALAVGSIYIQDAMLNQGLVAYPYIETTTAPVAGGILEDTPRLDWSGSCPSLLLEPSRTNLIPYSEYLDTYSKGAINIEHNAELSPEGVNNAARIIENTATSEHNLIIAPLNTANGTASFYYKPNGRNKFSVSLTYSTGVGEVYYDTSTLSANISGSDVTSASIESAENGWFKIVQTMPNVVVLRFRLNSDTGSTSYQGDGTSGGYIYGLQVEQDATYPTSYIPTYGSSVTRNSESSGVTNASEIICQNEGTLFVDFKFKQGSQTRFSISSGNASNWIFLGIPDSSRSSRVYIKTNNVIYVDEGVSNFFVDGERYKVCLSYKSGKWSLVSNGVIQLSGTETFANPSSEFSSLLITGGGTSISDAYTKINYNQALIFPTALSDADCITLTTI